MENQVIPNWLKKRAELTPNRIAMRFNQYTYTFEDMFYLAKQTAGRMTTLSVSDGQYVAVMLKNHLDSVVILFALQLIGVKTVILNHRLTEQEIAWQLSDSEAKTIITETEFLQKLFAVQKNVSQLTILDKDELQDIDYTEPKVKEEFDLDDVCTIMYTSGTTGKPKGVLQTYGNHWWSATGSALNLGIMESDSWLCAVPIFHISGYSILMRSIIYGIPVVLHESFDEKAVIHDIKKYDVTIMSVVSTMLARISKELKDGHLPPTFRCMLLGGGPAPAPLLEACVSKKIPVFQTYGMTETASQIVTLSSEYMLKKLGSAGKPLFPSQLKIVDEDGNEVSSHTEGEIIVKGPNVTSGYLNNVQATEEKLHNGWLNTGDIGYLDDEGFLFVLDRRSDLIISGGENIYPAEVESVLASHPAVEDVGVIGVEDPTWGQVPIAFIVWKKEHSSTFEELTLFCQERLAKYKVPKKIIPIDELPRNAAKKLVRRKLKQLL